MRQKQNIIPFDELHWDEEEKQWRCLSDDDIVGVIDACQKSGYVDLNSIFKVMRWAEEQRVGTILLRMFLSGQLNVNVGDKEDDEVSFEKKET